MISSNESGYDHGDYDHDHDDCDHVLNGYGHGHVLHGYGHGHVLRVNLFFIRDHVNNFYVHAFNSILDLQIFLLLILLERLLLDVYVFVSFILI